MIPANFEYFAPTSAAEAVRLLNTYRDKAKLLAGGHSLIPAMRLRLAQPPILIDISRIRDLVYVREEGGMLAIGAMTTHTALETDVKVRSLAPALAAAAAEVGDPQVRNRGTLGGSVAHADPAADYPAVLLALEAEFRLVGPNGARTVAAADFFQGPFTTALQPDELLAEVRLPLRAHVPELRTGQAYLKLGRKSSHFAIVGVAAYLEMQGSRCRTARIALNGVSALAPYRATVVERALDGVNLEREDAVAAAVAGVTEGVDLAEDPGCSAGFRAHLARVYTRRAIAAAVQRSG